MLYSLSAWTDFNGEIKFFYLFEHQKEVHVIGLFYIHIKQTFKILNRFNFSSF